MRAPLTAFARPLRRRSEWLAGTVGTLSVLAVVLTVGLLAFAPLGAPGARIGLSAAFITTAIGGMVYALAARSALPAGGPSSATALILAALVAQLAVGDDSSGAPVLADIAAVVGLTVVLSGLLQLAFAVLGLARLASYVPQPVLGGFMNGVALLILLAQLPLLMGHAPGTAVTGPVRVDPLLLGLAVAGGTWLLARRWPHAPAGLIMLTAGTLAYALARSQWPELALGERVTAPSAADAGVQLIGVVAHADAFSRLGLPWQAVGGTAVLLAIIGALESALNQLTIDRVLHARHDPRRELLALGGTNIACGLLGGLPLVMTRARAGAIVIAGGRGRTAALGGSALLGLLFLAGGSLLGALPLAVLAGLMIVTAVSMADTWTGRLLAQAWAGPRSRDVWSSLGIIAGVCVVTVWQGFAAGVALGLLLSMLSFIERMNRSLLRSRTSAVARPSRRVYAPALAPRLRAVRERIAVFELEGALFFGSGERLLVEADRLDAGCRCLVLDLRRLGTLDDSGALVLEQLAERLRRRDVMLMLAGVVPGLPAAEALRAYGVALPSWADADRAVEAAEHRLLGDGGAPAPDAVPLAACGLFDGLDDAGRAAVLPHLEPRTLAAGEWLFAEGDPADRLFIITRGSVSVITRGVDGRPGQRYLSVSPGVMLGETAMLDGGGRSAGAVADTPVQVHALTQAGLDALQRGHPAVAVQLYRNIGKTLSQRLRSASEAWRAQAG